LASQFAGRTVEKEYLALVHGVIPLDSGRVEKPVARDPNNRLRMTTRLATGRAAISEYKVLRRFEKCTYVPGTHPDRKDAPDRVHMSSIGHPLVGDKLYGRRRACREFRDGAVFSALTQARVHLAGHRRAGSRWPLPAELERVLAGLL
jgi:23S rRNA pseudouridine1911/1915/1917 synthase